MAKHTSTARTMLGFIRSVLARWLPFLARHETLADIYNYRDIKDLYATSGQPSEAQFQLIAQAGYQRVINLAPTSMLENSVVAEAEILQDLGIDYVHIPVDFKNPTSTDFDTFIDSLQTEQKVWVHCAANMRVSAFTYRYRTEVLGQEELTCRQDLEAIWEPMGVWSEFISKPAQSA